MKIVSSCFICLTLLLILAPPIFPRTWYINTDGTGDAPTIQAGVDSSVAGDTVLVADSRRTKFLQRVRKMLKSMESMI